MTALSALIEAALTVFASWTLAYHAVLIARLPANSVWPLFWVILGASVLALGLGRRWLRDLRRGLRDRMPALGVAALSLAAATLSLVCARPSADDFSYFHRARFQLAHLDEPFFLGDTAHDVPGLPSLSSLHVATSIEPLAAMAADKVGADPLWTYQNGGAAIATGALPIVFALLYQQVGLRRHAAVVASLLALLFLFIDGNINRSIGNISLLTMWVGKAILIGLHMPLTLLMAVQYLSRPSLATLSLVAMTGVAGVGLSGSGVFMVPVLVLACSAAYVLAYGLRRDRWRRSVLVCAGGAYGVGIAAAGIVGLIPSPADTSIWVDIWPADWWTNLLLGVGDGTTLLRDLVILLLVPLLALTWLRARLMLCVTAVLAAIFANPLLGPLWVHLTEPGAYWRLAYLFPLPWCAGLLWPALTRTIKDRWGRALSVGVALLAICATASAYQSSVVSPSPSKEPVQWKAASEYKLPPGDVTFADAVSARLSNLHVLAPTPVVVALGLLNPSVRFAATRPGESLHLFRNAGMADEGERRDRALVALDACAPSTDLLATASLVDAVVVRRCTGPSTSQLADLRASAPGAWVEVYGDEQYELVMQGQR
jgi:hypothetical protein